MVKRVFYGSRGKYKNQGGITVEQVLTVMQEEFTKNYDFYKDYDDIVIHKETEQIFKTNFVNGMVQLLPVSNHTAMEKIEQGLSEFAKELKRQGF